MNLSQEAQSDFIEANGVRLHYLEIGKCIVCAPEDSGEHSFLHPTGWIAESIAMWT